MQLYTLGRSPIVVDKVKIRGGFRGGVRGVRGVRPPKIRKAYVIQR
jgi:hypothetical protein